MHNCPTCNEPFEQGTKFCPTCGCNLEEENQGNMICPVCYKSYPAAEEYCEADGAKLVTPDKMIPKCIICGTPYPAEIKFCPKDGGAVIPEAYRNSKLTIASRRKMKDFHKANVGNRFMAYIIDATICTLLTLPTVFFYMMADVSNTSTPSTYLILAGLSYFIPFTYLFVKDGMGEGQSWGKKIMKVRVVHASDMSRCTVATSALRSLVTILLFVLPVVGWLVEPIMILTTADGRRLADRAAGTLVVDE